MNRTMSSDTTRQAFELGEQANYDGEARSANPYTAAGDIRAAWWGQGWCAAQAVRDEWELANHERAQQAEWLEGADLA